MADLDRNRREFLKVFGAAVAVAFTAAVMPLTSTPAGAPVIGTEFYTTSFVEAESSEEAWRVAADCCVYAMRRVERELGVRLGNFIHDTSWQGDRACWVVNTQAIVVGYA